MVKTSRGTEAIISLFQDLPPPPLTRGACPLRGWGGGGVQTKCRVGYLCLLSLFGFVAEFFFISSFFLFLSSAFCSDILISFFKVFILLQKNTEVLVVSKHNLKLCTICALFVQSWLAGQMMLKAVVCSILLQCISLPLGEQQKFTLILKKTSILFAKTHYMH